MAPEFHMRAENLLLPDRFKAQVSIAVTLSVVTQSEKLDNAFEFVISRFYYRNSDADLTRRNREAKDQRPLTLCSFIPSC